MQIRPRSPRPPSKSSQPVCEVVGTRWLPGTYSILDAAPLPMAIMEGTSHIVCYANPALCRLAGKSREAIVGKPFARIVPEGDACLLHLDRVYRTGKPESHNEQKQAQPLSLYWSYEVWPVMAGPEAQNSPAGVMILVIETDLLNRQTTAMNEALLVSAIRQHELMETTNKQLQAEIKERKQAEEALLQSHMLANAGRMAASIAHEINNPLEAVMNTIYLARTTADLPEAVCEYLDVANGELKRIAHITRQALGFYRESAVVTSNSVSGLMSSVADLLQAKIRATGTTIVQQCDQDLWVLGVSGELRQVLANLLANSLDAVESKRGIVKLRSSTVRCRETGLQCVRITVADNGKAINSATMKRIYEPFFTTKGAVGTGLGLWVTKQLVDKNGGSIRVRSTIDGVRRGTTFSIVLPAAVARQDGGRDAGQGTDTKL